MFRLENLITDVSRHSERVKKLLEPLETLLGISYFYHHTMKRNEEFTLLSTHPLIEEFWFGEKMYFSDPYVYHPSNYHSGFVF